MKVGNNLKELRLKANMTQEDLSRKCVLSQNALSSIELGKTNCSVKNALILAIVLKCKVEDIFYLRL